MLLFVPVGPLPETVAPAFRNLGEGMRFTGDACSNKQDSLAYRKPLDLSNES